MVAKTPSYIDHISANISLDTLCSKRNSVCSKRNSILTYASDVEYEKLFDIPYYIQLQDIESTNCTSCSPIEKGNGVSKKKKTDTI